MLSTNKKYKILITSPWFTQKYLEELEKHFTVVRNNMLRWFNEDELIEIISEYDAIIAGLDPFNKRVLEKAKNLKIIARRGIGFDTVDINYCKEHGIIVTNTPVQEEHKAVAEFTVGLIFDLIRNITRSVISLKEGSWERAKFLGRSLNNLTIGIIGLGNIGSTVASMLQSLGAKIMYYDPYVSDNKFLKVDLKDLFKLSDVVTIHAPLTNETLKLINNEIISLMKPDSYIVNVSRGEILDTESIVKAIKDKRLAAVAMDVFDQEPPENKDLLLNDKIICTPHIAAFSKEAFDKIDRICTKNVINVLIEHKEPDFKVS